MSIPSSLLLLSLIILGYLPGSFCQEQAERKQTENLHEGSLLRSDSLAGTRVIYQDNDLKILQEIFSEFGEFKGSTADLMLLLGGSFAKSPYVEKSLEHEPEVLVVNLREFDCTTYVESCLAIARTIQSRNPGFERFVTELKKIRYRKGEVDGYASRIHYFSDWIHVNDQKGIIRDVSRELGGTAISKEINFMSTHPDSYTQLIKDEELVDIIAIQEQELSKREMLYIPKDRIREVEADLRAGDIVGITTGIKGLDIIHVGIIWKKPDGSVHLSHASSKYKRVLISTEPLEDYLAKNKSASGIMVARPL